MSNESKVREDAYDAWTRTVGVSNAPGGNLAMSPLDAWRAAWQASRAAALEEAAEALRLLRPNSEGYKRSEWDKFDWEQLRRRHRQGLRHRRRRDPRHRGQGGAMSGEVKLACAGDAETFVASSSGTWIALPAAEFEKWRRVVEAARHWGQHNDGWVIGDADSLLPSKRLKAALDALLRDQPPGPVGAKEGE